MAVKPIEEVLADTLERIATALEELVEVQKTEPLGKIIHPSMKRPQWCDLHNMAWPHDWNDGTAYVCKGKGREEKK